MAAGGSHEDFLRVVNRGASRTTGSDASMHHLTIDNLVESVEMGNLQRSDGLYGQCESVIGAAVTRWAA